MDLLRQSADAVELRLSRVEVRAIANLLLVTENWPFEAVGPREFVRQLHQDFLDAAEGLDQPNP